MADQTIERYIRPYAEARANMLDRARRGLFEYTDYETVEGVLNSIDSLDRDAWAAAFSAVAEPFEGQAEQAAAAGDAAAAEHNYLRAYAYFRMGRYPTTNAPGKRRAYERSVECYLKAARYFHPAQERVEIPFAGRPGEGNVIVGYLRLPAGSGPWPILAAWGGIDGYKEDRRAGPYLDRGIAVLSLDNAGVGEAPLKGAHDADRYFETIFDWIGRQHELDAERLAIMGNSTGGYWAAKLAHTQRHRIKCAVNHGGCAHCTFTPSWIEKAQHGEYAYELAEALAYAFLGDDATFDDWVRESPKLSLVDQGVLDQPCSALLCVNGTKDSIFPIEDMYLLFERGDPKTGFFPPVGHMGFTPRTAGVILEWICGQLGVAAAA